MNTHSCVEVLCRELLYACLHELQLSAYNCTFCFNWLELLHGCADSLGNSKPCVWLCNLARWLRLQGVLFAAIRHKCLPVSVGYATVCKHSLVRVGDLVPHCDSGFLRQACQFTRLSCIHMVRRHSSSESSGLSWAKQQRTPWLDVLWHRPTLPVTTREALLSEAGFEKVFRTQNWVR